MDYKEKFLARAELINIREEDGAQQYRLDIKLNGFNIVWLTGSTRPANVKIGDKGNLIYRSTKSYGLYFFEKDK